MRPASRDTPPKHDVRTLRLPAVALSVARIGPPAGFNFPMGRLPQPLTTTAEGANVNQATSGDDPWDAATVELRFGRGQRMPGGTVLAARTSAPCPSRLREGLVSSEDRSHNSVEFS